MAPQRTPQPRRRGSLGVGGFGGRSGRFDGHNSIYGQPTRSPALQPFATSSKAQMRICESSEAHIPHALALQDAGKARRRTKTPTRVGMNGGDPLRGEAPMSAAQIVMGDDDTAKLSPMKLRALEAAEARARAAEERAAAAEAHADAVKAAAQEAAEEADARLSHAERRVLEVQQAAHEAALQAETAKRELAKSQAQAANVSAKASSFEHKYESERSRLEQAIEAQFREQRKREDEQQKLASQLREAEKQLTQLRQRERQRLREQQMRDEQYRLEKLEILKAGAGVPGKGTKFPRRPDEGASGSGSFKARSASPSWRPVENLQSRSELLRPASTCSRPNPSCRTAKHRKASTLVPKREPTDWAARRKQQVERAALLRAQKAGFLAPDEVVSPIELNAPSPDSFATSVETEEGCTASIPTSSPNSSSELKEAMPRVIHGVPTPFIAHEDDNTIAETADLQEQHDESDRCRAPSWLPRLPPASSASALVGKQAEDRTSEVLVRKAVSENAETLSLSSPPVDTSMTAEGFPYKIDRSLLRLDLSKLQREEVDDSLPVAQPHTPTHEVVAGLGQAQEDGVESARPSDSEDDIASSRSLDSEGDIASSRALDSEGDIGSSRALDRERQVGEVSSEADLSDTCSENDVFTTNTESSSPRIDYQPAAGKLPCYFATGFTKKQYHAASLAPEVIGSEMDEVIELRKMLARSPRRPQPYLSNA
ncbi:hypothetical protein AB1Y20_012973 [Prymnesium parvum]|uniref:Uncharacterized protein n=1 Tax=Prymnesium parvum TaxID=97485 RepID=A0AB34IM27_PRYPA